MERFRAYRLPAWRRLLVILFSAAIVASGASAEATQPRCAAPSPAAMLGSAATPSIFIAVAPGGALSCWAATSPPIPAASRFPTSGPRSRHRTLSAGARGPVTMATVLTSSPSPLMRAKAIVPSEVVLNERSSRRRRRLRAGAILHAAMPPAPGSDYATPAPWSATWSRSRPVGSRQCSDLRPTARAPRHCRSSMRWPVSCRPASQRVVRAPLCWRRRPEARVGRPRTCSRRSSISRATHGAMSTGSITCRGRGRGATARRWPRRPPPGRSRSSSLATAG